MIRVGFRLFGGATWQGGRNYLWNLLYALAESPRIAPVILHSPDEDVGDLRMDGVELFATHRLLDSPRARFAGRLIENVVRRNPIEGQWLSRARIDVLSHAMPVGSKPTIGWVPDVQHRHLPQLSSRFERFMRDRLFRELLRDAEVVVTSSAAAREDLIRFYAPDESKIRVLRFVSQPRLAPGKIIPLDELRVKFDIPARFVHLPNQLWKHKNHELVVDALRRVRDVVVVATGPTEDYRHADVFDSLMARVKSNRLVSRFRHLGLVSFPELISLMRHSVAVVNPSRFEGWSTTVEEAKSLGKRVLVSDIPVHREQAPARASYFRVDDADTLADQLGEAWQLFDAEVDARAAAEAAAALPARTRAFAETYESIVQDVVRR